MSVIDKLTKWARKKSPWLIHFNTGACNACDIELVVTVTPRYDIERFGMQLKGSPRHADILVCSGPITIQQKERLKMIYDQMPDPKYVIALGSCACSAGVYNGCYCVEGGIDTLIPVDMYIPGCPAKPEAIIDGLVKLLKKFDDDKGNKNNKKEKNVKNKKQIIETTESALKEGGEQNGNDNAT